MPRQRIGQLVGQALREELQLTLLSNDQDDVLDRHELTASGLRHHA